MEDSKGSGGRPESFFAGKGFYIVLFLCAAVIGVSAWSLLRGTGTVEEPGISDIELSEQEAGETTPAGGTEYEETMWEVPAYAQEMPADPQAPAVIAQAPTEPEPEQVSTEPLSFIWPVAGSMETPYSITALMYDRTMADWRTHDGIDIAASVGDKVMAAASGTVTDVYHDDFYGTTVVMDYGGGLTGVYSNLQELPTVGIGDVILGGETIGAVGCTALYESAMAPHLHYAMRLNGQSVDPGAYLPAR